MSVTVHFHEVDEFLQELERDVDDPLVTIERGIVRATPLYRTVAAGVRAVSVSCSYVSTRPRALPALVHVDAYAGQLWGQSEVDEKTTERRDALMDAVREACERLCLDVRVGFFQAVAAA